VPQKNYNLAVTIDLSKKALVSNITAFLLRRSLLKSKDLKKSCATARTIPS
jgi:hypothetical protein